MKKIAFYCASALMLFGSCEKQEPITIQPPTDVSLRVDGSYNPGTLIGQTNTGIGRFEITYTSQRKPVSFSFGTETDIDFAKLKNFSFYVMKGSSIEYFSQVRPGPMSENIPGPGGSLTVSETDTTYKVVLYGDVDPSAYGYLQMSVTVDFMDGSPSLTAVGQRINFSPYEAVPVLTRHNITGVFLEDSVPMQAYELKITNPGTSPMSFPQFTMVITITDVGNNDTLTVYDLGWYVNGSDVNNRVDFVKGSQVIDTVREGANTVYVSYVTGTRDQRIPPGETYTFVPYFTPAGLRNSGNGIAVEILAQDPVFIPTGFLNIAGAGGNVKITPTQNSTSGGTISNLPWANVGSVFSAIPGQSTKSFNGAIFGSLGVQYFTQQ